MVKRKKTAVSKQPAVSSDEQPAGEMGYTLGKWAGQDQYKCNQCAFDSLDLDVMLDHLLFVHSVLALDGPAKFPPAAGPNPTEVQGAERADGVFEIELKEDQ